MAKQDEKAQLEERIKLIQAAARKQAEANGINFEGLKRHTGTFVYGGQVKSGNHQWILLDIPTGVEEKIQAHEQVIYLTTPESEELDSKKGVCQFYIGHPQLRDSAGQVQYIAGTTQAKPDKSVNRIEVELRETEKRKNNNVKVSEASERELNKMDDQDDTTSVYARIRIRKEAMLNRAVNVNQQQNVTGLYSALRRKVQEPVIDTAGMTP